MSTGERTGPSGPRAGFWQRFAAVILDGIILFIIDLVIDLILKPGAAGQQGIGVLIALIYFTSMEGGEKGATLGKRAMRIRVIDFNGQGSIGYGRAAIRYIGSILSSIIILIGYLWMLWDKEKQTWHDKFSTAVVVPTDAYRAVSSTDSGQATAEV